MIKDTSMWLWRSVLLSLLLNNSFVHQSYGAKILAVFSVPSLSHQIVYHELTKELARRGHEVVVLTPNPDNDSTVPPERYTQIDVQELSYKIFREDFKFAQVRSGPNSPIYNYPDLKKSFHKIFDAQLSSPQAQLILFKNETQHFDLVFGECYVLGTLSFAAKFKAPSIGICSTSPMISSFEAIGNPTQPVLYPDMFRIRVGNLSLIDKMYAVYNYLLIQYFDIDMYKSEDRVIMKHFGVNTPSAAELESNMDMLFINVHPLMNGIRPAVPALVYLGGMHLKAHKPLPEDLKNFLDSSKKGVIYMSLGTNVLSKDLGMSKLKVFLEVFGSLPYNILWKYEDEDLLGKPANVMISKWLPQQDLLGHKNIKAFIMQGGQQSLDEAIRDEVPIIGIPFFADQVLNVQKVVLNGIGVKLEIDTLKASELREAIITVTEDKRYKENMRRLNDLLSDQPMNPLQRAVWWTEYVLRHKGAKHLRAPAADVSLIGYFMLEVIAAFAAIILIPILVFVKIASLLISKFRRSVKTKKS